MLTASQFGAHSAMYLSILAYGPLLTTPPLLVLMISSTTNSANFSAERPSFGCASPLAQLAIMLLMVAYLEVGGMSKPAASLTWRLLLMTPGRMVTTLTPNGASSSRKVSDKVFKAALDVAYAAVGGSNPVEVSQPQNDLITT